MTENSTLSGDTEALQQIAAELKRLNDRFEPVPWYKLDTGKPLGYGFMGLLFIFFSMAAQDEMKGFLLITGSLFFVAQSIAGSRLKR